VPVEPPPNIWEFPPADEAAADDEIVAVGADLEPGTLLAAYRGGLFPMYAGRLLAWWSPDPRGIVPLDGFHCSRSLRRSIGRFDISVNTAFVDVVEACGDPERPNGWIDESFVDAYARLHELGWAHSVEVWRGGVLAGGLYGVRIGRFFAGESMFHRETDASKIALMALVERLKDRGYQLLDTQWTTPHLARFGAVDVTRREYLRRLERALRISCGF
jgi:leucyl/phenylalanyl-tRNA---protein transferase